MNEEKKIAIERMESIAFDVCDAIREIRSIYKDLSKGDDILAAVDPPLRRKLHEMRDAAQELRDEINNIKCYIR